MKVIGAIAIGLMTGRFTTALFLNLKILQYQHAKPSCSRIYKSQSTAYYHTANRTRHCLGTQRYEYRFSWPTATKTTKKTMFSGSIYVVNAGCNYSSWAGAAEVMRARIFWEA